MRIRPFVVCFVLLSSLLTFSGCWPWKEFHHFHHHHQQQPAADAPNAIRLQGRSFVPRRGIARELLDRLPAEAEGRVHVLVQFERVPGREGRQALREELGVELLDPVPERAFFAVMPNRREVARRLIEGDHGVRWIGRVRPGDKIAPWLDEGRSLPAHARRPDGRGELVVIFFGDVEESEQRRLLARLLDEPPARIEPLNGWRVVAGPAAVARLAAEDAVRWIEEVPPPPQDDNDGVRGPTAVDSEAVAPPSTFGLTGAGVTIGHWESTHASENHGDFAGRITIADPPIPLFERSQAHDETVTANGQHDVGEAIYSDLDDSRTVSTGDVRQTGPLATGPVAAGDADVGNALVFFQPNEGYTDATPFDFVYTPGEVAYRDLDGNAQVSVGDLRLTSAGPSPGLGAGTTVAAGQGDLGTAIRRFPTNPHYHATHTAGTTLGSGARSAAAGGSANQWAGVAPGAALRSYSGNPVSGASPGAGDEYGDAAANGVTLSTNSWGTSHVHQQFAPQTGYELGSQYYDAVISGRRSDGTATGVGRVLIFGSAGNNGRPERHDESVAANGQYDAGEGVYWDVNDDGQVSLFDLRLSVAGFADSSQVAGGAADLGNALVNFAFNETHDDSVSLNPGSRITFNAGEGVYRDLDGSLGVSAGDTRVTAAGGFAAGSVVAAGDADAGTALRRFVLWGNVRVPNSAKGTVEVANVDTNTAVLSASSSRGPTDDGRIKPDLSGPGSQIGGDGGVTSAFPGNVYYSVSGTSMSTPAVAGAGALVTEWYRSACAAAGPAPETLRALLIHSAEDLTAIPSVAGTFAGPDFAYGFGRVRVPEAVAQVPHHLTATANALGDQNYTVTIGRFEGLRVTLAWDDPPWTANAAPSAATGRLHNDLDLLLIAPDGSQHTPWLANGANPFATATRSIVAAGGAVPASARDRRNTVEQVRVDDAAPGTWTIRVTTSTLNLPNQTYTLVADAIAPQDSPCAAAPAADVWMRDNLADTGVVPSTGTLYRSPDLWNRLTADGMTGHENPEFGQENYIYANVRNAGAAAVATSLDVWVGQASTGLTWPDAFRYVGRIPVANLAAGGSQQVGPLAWQPPMPNPSDHFCFYLRLTSPQDPITIAEGTGVAANTRNSNNIAWRNINVVDLLSSRTVTFLMGNVETRGADVDLRLEIDPELLADGAVTLNLPEQLVERWAERDQPGPGVENLGRRQPIYSPTQDRWPERPRPAMGGAEPAAASPDDAEELSTWHHRVGTRYRPPRHQPPYEPRTEPQTTPPEEPGAMVPFGLTRSQVRLAGFALRDREASPLSLTLRSDSEERKEYEVHVIQEQDGEVVGGIVYIVRVGGHDE